MYRIATVVLLAFAPLLNCVARSHAAEPVERPNVLVVLADDQGWGDVSLNGNTNLHTPNIDALAADGARFRYFCVQPVCSPTRAEFLTGRWHPRCGVRDVSSGGERLDLDERTVAEAFQAAGYATGCFGKWHNGTQYPYHPNGRGFEEYYGFTSGHWGEYFDPPLDHNGQPVRGHGYITDDLTDHAIEFLKHNAAAGKPSFCYLAFNTPHSPMQVPDRYWERFDHKPLELTGSQRENLDHTRAALAMCENIDDNVGRLLAFLRESKLDQSTIVVYFSDNGPNGPRWNDGLKGHKGSTDEGGVRSPLHIRWLGRIRPGTVVATMGGAVDLYPTLIDLAEVDRVGDLPLDGISLAPWLLGKNPPLPDRVLFHHWAGKVGARNQRFRLDATGQLFDLTSDPGQTKNVAAEYADVADGLSRAVARYRADVLSQISGPDERPFLVGYTEFPRTVLPARDGVPRGEVRRSAPAPNCSFFTGWSSPDDRMTWDVEVHSAGRYEAIVRYTCAKADVGSSVELSFGDATWKGTIADAFDPPLRGSESDRVPRRAESYVKDFRPMSLGIAELPAGKATLTLRATKVAGGQVADVRAIELVLLK